MKKILIWDRNMSLKNAGGPNGYLYNIHEYLKNYPSLFVFFYSDVSNNEHGGKEQINKEYHSGIRKSLLNRFSNSLWFKIYLTYFAKIKLSEKDVEIANQYDYVHLHSIPLMRYFTHDSRVKANIVLTTHTPEPLIDEISSPFLKNIFKIFPFFRDYFIRKELRDYSCANVLMFPCSFALEVYTNASPIFEKGFKSLHNKIHFVPTSIYPNEVGPFDSNYCSVLSDEERRGLKICYIGRHNRIKGYDSLKRLACNYLQNNENCCFVIGGTESPITRLANKRWHELGWINTHELLSEVDVFILPNKETYFDIIALEVLRQGIPIIMTRTGGNKWYEDQHIVGTFLYEYDDNISFDKALSEVKKLKDTNMFQDYCLKIKACFKEKLSMRIYMENYEQFISQL